jgi:hypothetical protein
MKYGVNHFFLVTVISNVFIIFLIFLTEISDDPLKRMIIHEGGLVENATVLAYFLCLLSLIINSGLQNIQKMWTLYISISLLMLREMDFHDRFTTLGIFKIKFFLSPHVPGVEKAIGILVILLIIFIAYRFYKQYFRYFLQKLQERKPFTFYIIFSICYMGIAFGLDGLPRKLESIGVTGPERVISICNTTEEVFELMIPVMFMMSILAFFHQQKLESTIQP